ncbi:phenylalanine--tRNA ligase subunit beta [Coprothermobacteraceae bacterium]|nr:phenylalanine--tRNA ligase subunit beta [Coprothermobacteraceae bacterium]
MRFAYSQLSRFWKEAVSWEQVKAYLEKHLEVEVENEIALDVAPSVKLLRVETEDGKHVAKDENTTIPIQTCTLEEGCYVAVDLGAGDIPTARQLGLEELFAADEPIVFKDANCVPLKEYLGLPDTLVKLSVLPNRGDLSHVFGLAREVALGLGLTLAEPHVSLDVPKGNGRVSISTEGCLVYVGLLLEDVRVTESPDWLKLELAKYGQRSINNVVDLTNYFLFTYGQPMHAFDFDKLQGQRVVVRQARSNESIITLGGEEAHLDENCMVIADEFRPVAVAGVIGGKESATTPETKRVLLEVACFAPPYVATSSRRLGIRTDASMLFERGVSPAGQTLMGLMFGEMAQKMGMGTPVALWIAGSEQSSKRVMFDIDRVSKLSSLPTQVFFEMVQKRGWNIEGSEVVIPSYRWDVNLDDDLADELVKYVGYDAVPSLPLTEYVGFSETPTLAKERRLRELSSQYFQEVFLVSLLSDRDVELQKLTEVVAVDNPVSMELAFLRPNLRSTLIKAALLNQNRFKENIHIFEIGSVFVPDGNGVREERHIGFLAKGLYWESALDRETWTYRHFKGLLENIFTSYGVSLEWENHQLPWAEGNYGGVVKYGGFVLGEVGIVKSQICQAYDLKGTVFFAEFNLAVLPHEVNKQPQWPLKYPYSWRDFSIVMPVSEPVSSLSILFEGEALVREWTVVDIYHGEKIGNGYKSVTVRAYMGEDERTVTSDEVDIAARRIIERIKDAGWHLRS